MDIVDFSGDPAQIKRMADDVISVLKSQSSSLANNVERFNSILLKEVETSFRARKDELLKRAGVLASLGVPIKKATSVPATFAVPAQRKQVIAKPTATQTTAKAPDPTLDESVYREVLQTIHDIGTITGSNPRWPRRSGY